MRTIQGLWYPDGKHTGRIQPFHKFYRHIHLQNVEFSNTFSVSLFD